MLVMFPKANKVMMIRPPEDGGSGCKVELGKFLPSRLRAVLIEPDLVRIVADELAGALDDEGWDRRLLCQEILCLPGEVRVRSARFLSELNSGFL